MNGNCDASSVGAYGKTSGGTAGSCVTCVTGVLTGGLYGVPLSGLRPGMVGGNAAVAENTAVMMPLSAALVTVVAPATVKLSAATPVKVKPVSGVRVIVAVYTRSAPKTAPAVPPLCSHVTAPVNCAVGVMAVTGAAPKAGGVTPSFTKMSITATGVAVSDASAPTPAMLIARTLKIYAVPLVKLVNV